MKILHTVRTYAPSVGGMQEVVRQLSEQLVRMGHEVTVATGSSVDRRVEQLNGVKIAEFQVDGNLAQGLSGDLRGYRDFVLNSQFDVVTCFAAQQWATDVLLPVLDQIEAAKVFVPTGFSGLYDESFRDYFSAMGQWLKQFDMNVFLSNSYRDINFARSVGAENMVVIPNGASTEEFLSEIPVDVRTKLNIPQDQLLVLLVGSHSGLKGHTEAIEIFRQAGLKKATLLIVAGNDAGGCRDTCKRQAYLSQYRPSWLMARKKLIVRSMSRVETVAAFRVADLLLFPSNIECSPLVLFEAMASRTPFVTTDVGNAAEIVQWSNGGKLLPTTIDARGHSHVEIRAAARTVRQLCLDPEQRKEMATSGFNAWQDRFTWEKIAQQYENLYDSLVRRRHGD